MKEAWIVSLGDHPDEGTTVQAVFRSHRQALDWAADDLMIQVDDWQADEDPEDGTRFARWTYEADGIFAVLEGFRVSKRDETGREVSGK